MKKILARWYSILGLAFIIWGIHAIVTKEYTYRVAPTITGGRAIALGIIHIIIGLWFLIIDFRKLKKDENNTNS